MALHVLRLAVGRQAHDLVLAGVDLEPGVVGEGGVEQPERVRKGNLPERRQLACPAPTHADVVAHSPTPSMQRTAAVSKGDGIEGRGRVRLVVLAEEDRGSRAS